MKETKNFTIQLFRLVGALMVIAIHTNPFMEINAYIAKGITGILTRVAVPFFFSLAGYFYMKKIEDKKDYLKKYIYKILKIYIIWGVIYFPYSFIYSSIKSERSLIFSVAAYVRNTIFGGAHFHLWYLPALIFAIILFDLLHRNVQMNKIKILATILYLVGLFGTSYYGLLKGNLKLIMDIYSKIFITTRNGLFMGFPFVVLGAELAKQNLNKYTRKKTSINIIIFYFLITLEAFIVFKVKSSKMSDTYILLPILVYYIMIFSINDFINKSSEKILKLISFEDYSLGIYLIHGIYLIIFSKFLSIIGLANQRTLYFILVTIFSVGNIWIIKKVIKTNHKKLEKISAFV